MIRKVLSEQIWVRIAHKKPGTKFYLEIVSGSVVL